MWQTVVGGKFHSLGIDHDEFELFGRVVVEEGNKEAVESHGFSASSCSRNKEMRHFGKIRHHGLSGDITAKSDFNFGTLLHINLGLHHLAHVHSGAHRTRNFNSHQRFSGNGRFNTNSRRRQSQSNIVLQRRDFGKLHSVRRSQRVLHNGRAHVNFVHAHINAELLKFRFNEVRLALQIGLIDFNAVPPNLQKVQRRIGPFNFLRLFLPLFIHHHELILDVFIFFLRGPVLHLLQTKLF